ncbi:hypothetical protein [Uliginosibacterium aquaticum]|uniref:Uncharacterized protein n=1 Tax=Uliginosibacterium aquaticum TaxID=2731212 RepID=A0ABX2IIU3_9RHOO|nr:hypothetical protein [Uliginosibacterium aquaticum]NSL54912.1 hypothetical protein [Uliginosibacterium aquaticum]
MSSFVSGYVSGLDFFLGVLGMGLAFVTVLISVVFGFWLGAYVFGIFRYRCEYGSWAFSVSEIFD